MAVCNLDLQVLEGEFLVVVGPSGCGKSTLLRLIAGLEAPTSGELLLNGRNAARLAAHERNVALVHQSGALYPHFTVFGNLAFGVRKLPRDEAAARVRRAAEMLGIGALLDRYPGELSGGERQRVALGRAVVRQAEVWLLDEPLSSLDAPLRRELRRELRRLHGELGATMVYVTHDPAEAKSLGDRLAVMQAGTIVQTGKAAEVLARPVNDWTRELLHDEFDGDDGFGGKDGLREGGGFDGKSGGKRRDERGEMRLASEKLSVVGA